MSDGAGYEVVVAAPSAVVRDGPIHEAVASHPQEMADIMANLAWAVTDEHDLVQYLQQVVDLAVQIVAGTSCAGVTVCGGGRPLTAVFTDSFTSQVDAHQHEAGDGPSLTAMRTGQKVCVAVTDTEQRWPQFAADAAEIGVSSFLAAPLGAADDGPRVGSLNLYSRDPDGFGDHEAVLLDVLVDRASRAITEYTRTVAAEELVEQLRQALETRAPIEQAKGILMAAHQLDGAAAFALLRQRSQETNTKLHTVAVQLVLEHTGATAPEGRTTS